MRRHLVLLCYACLLPSWCGAVLESRDADEVRRIKKEWRAINVENLKLAKQLDGLQAAYRQVLSVEEERRSLVERGLRVRQITAFLEARLIRKWQSKSGAQIVARIKAISESTVTLLTGEGKEVRIDLDNLATEDRVFLHNLRRCNSFSPDE